MKNSSDQFLSGILYKATGNLKTSSLQGVLYRTSHTEHLRYIHPQCHKTLDIFFQRVQETLRHTSWKFTPSVVVLGEKWKNHQTFQNREFY